MHAILVVYKHSQLGLRALAVDRKGADENVVKWLVEKSEECGYAGVKLTLKSDQEPAMLALKKAIAFHRKAETPLIEPPVRESSRTGRLNGRFGDGKDSSVH